MDVEHDGVGWQQITDALRVACGFRHVGHRHVLEPRFDEFGQVAVAVGRRCIRCAQSRFFQAATRRHQAHAQFNQADVRFEVRHAVCAVHQGLATAAQSQARHCGDHRHLCVFHAHRGVLEFLHERLNRFRAAFHEQWHGRLQIRARRERAAGQ